MRARGNDLRGVLGRSTHISTHSPWGQKRLCIKCGISNTHADLNRVQLSGQRTITDIAARYGFRVPDYRYENFPREGYGPFLVERADLVNEILRKANPHFSIHINGCRGSGKTTLLQQIGEKLFSEGKEVYFFRSASGLNRESSLDFVHDLVETRRAAYVLVDETQNNVDSEAFVSLLKNPNGHQVTTIGAGVPEYRTISSQFTHKVGTERLFLESPEVLESEGVVEYFSRDATEAETPKIRELLLYLRSYCRGHIYPLMFLAEQLASKITREGKSVAEVVDYFNSPDFREQDCFRLMAQRILPSIETTDIRPLLYKIQDEQKLYDLRRKGICDASNKILSQLLFESILMVLRPAVDFPYKLNAGLDGVQQLLSFSLPSLSWEQYNAHGGPGEEALTFEMLVILNGLQQLGTRQFNPKLVDAGTARRKPGIYLNSNVDCYVESVLTTANIDRERKKLDEHISRFYWQQYKDPFKRREPAYYQTRGSGFAILNYQNFGSEPLQPFDDFFQGEIFNKRVFTFLMQSKELYVGSTCIAGPSNR